MFHLFKSVQFLSVLIIISVIETQLPTKKKSPTMGSPGKQLSIASHQVLDTILWWEKKTHEKSVIWHSRGTILYIVHTIITRILNILTCNDYNYIYIYSNYPHSWNHLHISPYIMHDRMSSQNKNLGQRPLYQINNAKR